MEIKNARFLVSSSKVSQCPKPDRPEFAFIGRSNVGKSSLINMLTGQKSLAKTSSTPGKTTLINHFLINSFPDKGIAGWYLVDLPGYGFAKRSKKQRENWQSMIQSYLQERPNLHTIFVLIDSRISPQKIDIDFINQLGEWGIPFNLIFTKSDKNNQSTTAKNVKAFDQELAKYWQFLPAQFVTSAVKRAGRNKVLDFIGEILERPEDPID